MDPNDALLLRRLLATRPVAALATLDRGEPAVSMVPFVLPAGRTDLVIHVSALATHKSGPAQPRRSAAGIEAIEKISSPRKLRRPIAPRSAAVKSGFTQPRRYASSKVAAWVERISAMTGR